MCLVRNYHASEIVPRTGEKLVEEAGVGLALLVFTVQLGRWSKSFFVFQRYGSTCLGLLGRIVSQCIRFSNRHIVHFTYLPILSVYHTSIVR